MKATLVPDTSGFEPKPRGIPREHCLMCGIAVLLVSVSATVGIGSNSDPKLEARWRGEYPVAAAKWEEIERNFWAEGKLSFHFKDGGTSRTNALKVAASGDKKLYIRDQREYFPSDRPGSDRKPLDTDVDCEIPEYRFTLKKTPPAMDFIIEEYGPYKAVEKDDVSDFSH